MSENVLKSPRPPYYKLHYTILINPASNLYRPYTWQLFILLSALQYL